VVVEDLLSERVVRRLPAGRVAGTDERLLEQVGIESREGTREQFLEARLG
jgi:hypothetical protein